MSSHEHFISMAGFGTALDGVGLVPPLARQPLCPTPIEALELLCFLVSPNALLAPPVVQSAFPTVLERRRTQRRTALCPTLNSDSGEGFKASQQISSRCRYFLVFWAPAKHGVPRLCHSMHNRSGSPRFRRLLSTGLVQHSALEC